MKISCEMMWDDVAGKLELLHLSLSRNVSINKDEGTMENMDDAAIVGSVTLPCEDDDELQPEHMSTEKSSSMC
jgi:hypothetical protein